MRVITSIRVCCALPLFSEKSGLSRGIRENSLLIIFPLIFSQDLTGIENLSVCRDVLQRHNWNLEVAVQVSSFEYFNRGGSGLKV